MIPIERLKIPPIEPGTPIAVRNCSECKAPINVPLALFNKLLECPFCHKGILFRNKTDQAKETVGCLGYFLGSFVLLMVGSWLITFLPEDPNPPLGWIGRILRAIWRAIAGS